jgi:hypothetical protein
LLINKEEINVDWWIKKIKKLILNWIKR